MPFPILNVGFMRPDGMALFPFILVRRKELRFNPTLINHETIHLWQQLELLVLPFYIAYVLNYFVNLLRYRNHYRAYLEIVFEREAYKHEQDLNYIKRRKLFGWRQFL